MLTAVVSRQTLVTGSPGSFPALGPHTLKGLGYLAKVV